MIDEETLINKLVKGMRDGAIELPADVTLKLESSYQSETDDIPKMQFKAILDNIKLAHDEGLPLCQDTGIQVFFIKAGYDFPYLNDIHKAIPLAIERATKEIPLRPNTVDPFTGKNPKNNLGHNMPAVTVELVEGDSATIHILPKGGGSENMSALWMLTPTQGFKGLKKKVLEHIQFAAGKPCPPIILGIGVGGGADMAMKLAKKALLRPLDSTNPNGNIAAMEKDILDAVNELGVGPMGLGGKTTALAVNIEYTSRHPATFPTALVIQCWCDRRATIRISKDGVISND
ncbi:MAG: fumarate hydratase [Candidatus Thermoplasmatota archaeon]|nr:fumarate hydratase [Euryarchaeota archaeon]MBU4032287.1 fumarate hydratase [Candidatus Thermoplasmatota archaeon]MBU4072251.1 fumarate hydratase [Candidatus Thermoplasmatota archaeon]MBU4144778.1 fumarate hydratase [Candidatus Thermoplasmatota archaeon]MBU4591464.1 fumarate hydratase [Candidatus Thermoplasmatota archaeon]